MVDLKVSLLETEEFKALLDALSTALIALYHYAESEEDEPAKTAIEDVRKTLAATEIGFEIKDGMTSYEL